MTYGIRILGTDGGGNFTVKDTTQNTINYQVVTSGQASSLSGLSPSNSRIFINVLLYLNITIILRTNCKLMLTANQHPVLKTLNTLMHREIPYSKDLLEYAF